MAKTAPLAAAVALVLILAVLTGGALLVQGEESEDLKGEGVRLPFAAAIAAFLAFVAGFALRDVLARRAERAARRPASGGKPA